MFFVPQISVPHDASAEVIEKAHDCLELILANGNLPADIEPPSGARVSWVPYTDSTIYIRPEREDENFTAHHRLPGPVLQRVLDLHLPQLR
jgi:hypothetical protein